MKLNSVKSVAVIGGATLGSLSALRLSNLGLSVEIFGPEPEPPKEASLIGEGKIHLECNCALSRESSYEQLIETAMTFVEII